MQTQKQKAEEMQSWKLYTIHNNPTAQSHENWSVLALTALSYLVLISTKIT